MDLLITKIMFSKTPRFLICDGRCEKAWGIANRDKVMLSSNDPDDFTFKADNEMELAPEKSPDTAGGFGKPLDKKHNRWCSRECERSTMIELKRFAWGDTQDVKLDTFETRIYNIKQGCNPTKTETENEQTNDTE